jgi:hypothetical protein
VIQRALILGSTIGASSTTTKPRILNIEFAEGKIGGLDDLVARMTCELCYFLSGLVINTPTSLSYA